MFVSSTSSRHATYSAIRIIDFIVEIVSSHRINTTLWHRMATMTTLMSSPHLASAPHPLPHSPLNLSPGASPALRPVKSTFKPTPPPLASSQSTPLGVSPSLSPRSYARAPTQRPYSYSPLMSRGTKQSAKELEGDPKMFAELVAGVVVSRDKKAKASNGNRSLPGSWDQERAELLVDVPVWSPGCFQGTQQPYHTLQHPPSWLTGQISPPCMPFETARFNTSMPSSLTSSLPTQSLPRTPYSPDLLLHHLLRIKRAHARRMHVVGVGVASDSRPAQ